VGIKVYYCGSLLRSSWNYRPDPSELHLSDAVDVDGTESRLRNSDKKAGDFQQSGVHRTDDQNCPFHDTRGKIF